MSGGRLGRDGTSLRAISYGIGPIGAEIARVAAAREGIQLVGAVDIDPAKVGRDLGEVIGLGRSLGVPVVADARALFAEAGADVLLHTTGSSLLGVRAQLEGAIDAGLNVVSTCEELAFPAAQYPEVAAELDRRCRDRGVTTLGTGVNPGFVMDALALALSAVCQEVTAVRCRRVVDASGRREPLQRKIGSGLDREEFAELVATKQVRHVGLHESVAMVAAGLGWALDEVIEETRPMIAEERVTTDYFDVAPGRVTGVDQLGRGIVGGREAITLSLQMYLGAKEPRDEIRIEGTPGVDLVLRGGTHGDRATTAIVVNTARRVVEAPPGLITMKDLPPAAWYA
ncbi:MAG: 2,4-diaminopentanoate dehydrogenase [uncultured Thermomicrobiales bacterium]|uniref:2,4-diaminopentanoate dehydrogenase n=1 Tax=uncultured Thermomicrobiales bacterium TaxID=1645740 RepID=A0A6J4UW84_9BACT|nr:MAG: 2,4-diaminopentanoate dehydrogenase [uncultured Thermomicrobiales bacterium]